MSKKKEDDEKPKRQVSPEDAAVKRILGELVSIGNEEYVPDLEQPDLGLATLRPNSRLGKLYGKTLQVLMDARSEEHDPEVTTFGAVHAAASWVVLQTVDAELVRAGGAPKPLKARHYLDEEGEPRGATENDRERWRIHRNDRAHFKMLLDARSKLFKNFMEGLKVMGLASMLESTVKPKGYEELNAEMQQEARRAGGDKARRVAEEATDAEFTECQDPPRDESSGASDGSTKSPGTTEPDSG